ncbi:RagB/SusD family nutrient uptake outer membrane protein [Pedobacter sp. PLR]|uniref:RagB/SusD family nutrient uptake outer membrane protein n=1 Tax=Pedobacter sp. PLR TaxID=2994465 RepID=UPI00224652E5|nr:RagB/SusD family nutrient uptake outer membrane protein [Pedobacter sp. PLR]MCX2451227.1 RagB/SusD family nutrient uptake outer membrane protein [Pedobacter sp. PLR]
MKKLIYHTLFAASFFLLVLSSCKKVTDKNDINNIKDELVWRDTVLTTAFANNLYLDIPAWNLAMDTYTEETRGGGPVTNGTVTPDATINYWPFVSIRKINTMIKELPASSGSSQLKNRLTGEAKFLRAYQYFQMVRRSGGVPIIAVPQELTDDIFVSRDKTSDCINFIVKDLDEAIALLPSVSSTANVGRASKEAALSLKARVLMDWASPRYNPTQDPGRWDLAYKASTAALTALNAKGYGLFDNYGSIFLTEMNKEVVFAIRYSNPGRTHNRDASVRPISVSVNATGGCQPTQELVDAYPMKDGSDVNTALTYQQRFSGRDDRFYATIVYNGATYFGRKQWTFVNSGIDGYKDVNGTYTGYYSKKAIDTTLTAPQGGTSGADYVAIRYADILLMEAEAANELGNTAPAYAALTKLRARAKITPGANNLYGLTPAMDMGTMRSRIQKERLVEFAFEHIRFFDLLRWNTLSSTLHGKTRKGLKLVSTTPGVAPNVATVFTESLEAIDLQPMIIQTNSPFYPIPRSIIQNNQNLKQTKGWESGSFDPLL